MGTVNEKDVQDEVMVKESKGRFGLKRGLWTRTSEVSVWEDDS